MEREWNETACAGEGTPSLQCIYMLRKRSCWMLFSHQLYFCRLTGVLQALVCGSQWASALPCVRTGVLLLQLDADQV